MKQAGAGEASGDTYFPSVHQHKTEHEQTKDRNSLMTVKEWQNRKINDEIEKNRKRKRQRSREREKEREEE